MVRKHLIVSLAIAPNLTCRRKQFATHAYIQSNPHHPHHKKQFSYGYEQYQIKLTNSSTTHNLMDSRKQGEQSALINCATSMRREVLAPLSNEKDTYIDFQDDLWVTFDPWLFIFQRWLLTFHLPKSDCWNFSSLLITIIRKI